MHFHAPDAMAFARKVLTRWKSISATIVSGRASHAISHCCRGIRLADSVIISHDLRGAPMSRALDVLQRGRQCGCQTIAPMRRMLSRRNSCTSSTDQF
jgi:hypothetical protein